MENKIIPVEGDDKDFWMIQSHFDLKDAHFFGKLTFSYQDGEVTNKRVEWNDKPPQNKPASGGNGSEVK